MKMLTGIMGNVGLNLWMKNRIKVEKYKHVPWRDIDKRTPLLAFM